MWKVSVSGPSRRAPPSPSDPPSGLIGSVPQPVDPAEGQGLVPDVQLLQPGQAGPDDHVPLGPRLERAPPAQVEHPLEHGVGIAPHGVEAGVGHVHELLLGLLLCFHPHLRSPYPVRLRGTLDCMPGSPGPRRGPPADSAQPALLDSGHGRTRGSRRWPGRRRRPPGHGRSAPPTCPTRPLRADRVFDRERTPDRPASTTRRSSGPAGACGGPRPGVVHAPGRPVAPRVPGGPRVGQHPRGHRPARAGGPADPPAGGPLRDRCRHLLLRHRGAGGGHRLRGGRGPGHRSGGGRALRRSTGPAAPPAPRARAGHALRDRGGAPAGRASWTCR